MQTQQTSINSSTDRIRMKINLRSLPSWSQIGALSGRCAAYSTARGPFNPGAGGPVHQRGAHVHFIWQNCISQHKRLAFWVNFLRIQYLKPRSTWWSWAGEQRGVLRACRAEHVRGRRGGHRHQVAGGGVLTSAPLRGGRGRVLTAGWDHIGHEDKQKVLQTLATTYKSQDIFTRMNLRVDGLDFLPRFRPPGVEAGEDIVGGMSVWRLNNIKLNFESCFTDSHFLSYISLFIYLHLYYKQRVGCTTCKMHFILFKLPSFAELHLQTCILLNQSLIMFWST